MDDGSHLRSIVMQEIEAGGGGGEDEPIGVDEDGNPVPDRVEPEIMSQEAFWFVFQTAFDWPAKVISQFEPMAAGVAIQNEERDIARMSSDNVYELLKIYYPKALSPGSPTIAHIMYAAPFLIAKVKIVREIFRARRARDVSTPEPQPSPRSAKEEMRAESGPNSSNDFSCTSQEPAQQPTEAEWTDIPPAAVIGGSWNLPDQQEAAH